MAQSTATIYINGKEVDNTLKGLTAEAARLNAELKRVELGSEAFAQKAESLRKVEAIIIDQKNALKEYANTFKAVTPVVEGSINQLKTKHQELVKELEHLKRGTTEYNAKLKEVGASAQEIKKVDAELAKVSKTTDVAKDSLLKITGVLAAAFVADRLVSFGNNLGAAVITYQKAASDLSAITGVTGAALDELKGKADELTTIYLEGGQKITNASEDILKGMKLVGSAQPELLKSADGLAEVTKQAIILAKAAGQEVPDAVTDLTTFMNQFELSASDAARAINVLAAGSKEGAAEIPDISAAIKEFGAGAKSANVSIEESVALVEVLGDKMIKGGEAGTKLRNILIAIKAPEGLDKEARRQLQEHGVSFDVLRDKTKSLGERLTELAKIQGDANALVQVFGKENVTAAEILLQNVNRFKQLEKAVTGTNEATKQAAIQADNLGGDIKVMRDEANNAALSFGQRLAPAARALVQGFTDLLRGIKENWTTIVIWTKAIVTAAIAVGSYYATVRIIPVLLDLWAKRQAVLTAITSGWSTVVGVLTGQITLATIAQRALNLIMSLNPIGLVVSAVAALTAGYLLFANTVTDTVRVQRLINDVNNEASKSIVEQKLKLEQLLKTAKDEKRSKDERLEAIKKLNALSPEYLGNLTLEKINTEGATAAVNKYVSALEKKAKSEAALQKRTELEKQLIDLGSGETDTSAGVLQTLGNSVLSGGNSALFGIKQVESSIKNATDAKNGIQTQIDALNKYVEKNKIDFSTPSSKLDNSTAAPGTKDAEKAEKEAERALNREDAKLQKLKDILIQYQNDVDQLNANHDAAEEIRIREKYEKQIAIAEELLLSKDPKIRTEAEDAIKTLQTLAESEIEAQQQKHLRDLEVNLKKHQEDVAALEKKDDEVKLTNIRQKYARELAELEILEKSKKPEIAIKAAADRVALEAAMNSELAAETDRFNAEKEAKEIAELDRELKARLQAEQDYLSFTGQNEALELLQLEDKYQKLITATNRSEDEITAIKLAAEKKRGEIINKNAKERIDKEKGVTDKIKQAEADLLEAKLNAYEQGAKMLRAIVGENTALGKALFAFEKGVAIARVILEYIKQRAFIISSGAAMGPAGPAYVVPALAAAGINAGVSIATIAATAIQEVRQKKGGGYNVRGEDDGEVYNAQYIGAPRTGMLPPSPSLVLASEAGPEYFVSNAALTRPDVAWHVRMIDNIVTNGSVRQKAEGGYDRPIIGNASATGQLSDPLLIAVLSELNDTLKQGIEANVSIGYNQIKDITTAQQRLQNIKG